MSTSSNQAALDGLIAAVNNSDNIKDAATSVFSTLKSHIINTDSKSKLHEDNFASLPFKTHDVDKEPALSKLWKSELRKKYDELSEFITKAVEKKFSQHELSTKLQEMSTLSLSKQPVLVFVIHGIGQHDDFKNFDVNWDGSNNKLEGGYFDFRLYLSRLLGSRSASSNGKEWFDGILEDLPLNLTVESIEWHSHIRETYEIENIIKNKISPEGVKQVRSFLSETVLDGFLYLSQHFGQLIINGVAKALNEKYERFCQHNPGFREHGNVHIFAHSLGTCITQDLLTGKRTDIETPKLDFKPNVVYLCGSPDTYFTLLQGNLFNEKGKLCQRKVNEGKTIPDDIRLFNIIHPLDPISYKISPLFYSGATDDSITDSESSNSGESSTATRSLNLGQKVATLNFSSSIFSSNSSSSKQDDFIKHMMTLLASLPSNKPSNSLPSNFFSSSTTSTDINFHLTDNIKNRVIDFELSVTSYEKLADLALAWTAHTNYWYDMNIYFLFYGAILEPFLFYFKSLEALGLMLKEKYMILSTKLNFRLISKTIEAEKVDFSSKLVYSLNKISVWNNITSYLSKKFIFLQDGLIFVFNEKLKTLFGEKLIEIDLNQYKFEHPEKKASEEEGSASTASFSTGLMNVFGSTGAIYFKLIPVPSASDDQSISENNKPGTRTTRKGSFTSGFGTEGVDALEFWTNEKEVSSKWIELLKERCYSNERTPSVLEVGGGEPINDNGSDSDLFNIEYASSLQIKTLKPWQPWQDIYLNLSKDNILRGYSKTPIIKPYEVIKLSQIQHVFTWREALYFRIIYENGNYFIFRAQNVIQYKLYLTYFTQNFREIDLNVDEMITRESDEILSKIYVFDFEIDDNNRGFSFLDNSNNLVTFFISIANNQILKKTRQDFIDLHSNLRKELKNKVTLPVLPITGLVPNFKTDYLNRKAIMYNGFLRQLSGMKEVTDSEAWSDFLKESE